MVKRGHLNLGSGIFRVSKPGVDVDAAGPNDFLLHESHLYSQPHFFQFVACPFASYTGGDQRDETVNVAVPNVTPNPLTLLYNAPNPTGHVFPHPRSAGSTSPGGIGNIDHWYVTAEATSATNVAVRFIKWSGSNKSPRGTYLVLMRRPT